MTPLALQMHTFPQDLADALPPMRPGQWADVIQSGLRVVENKARLNHAEVTGMEDVLEFLASLPSPEAVLAMKPSPELDARIDALLAKRNATGLSPAEEAECREIDLLEHYVRMAKLKAAARIKSSRTAAKATA